MERPHCRPHANARLQGHRLAAEPRDARVIALHQFGRQHQPFAPCQHDKARLAGVRLDLEDIPVRLRCRSCGAEFTVEQGATPFAPCPACGEELGHTVLSGRELYIEYLELE